MTTATPAVPYPPAPPMNMNPKHRVATAAADAARLPECAQRMPDDVANRVVLTLGRNLEKLGWKYRNPLAGENRVQLPAALAALAVIMLSSCHVKADQDLRMIKAAWVVIFCAVSLIALVHYLRARVHNRPRLAVPVTLFTDGAQCAAHSHWKRLQERYKRHVKANTLPPYEGAVSESFNPRSPSRSKRRPRARCAAVAVTLPLSHIDPP